MNVDQVTSQQQCIQYLCNKHGQTMSPNEIRDTVLLYLNNTWERPHFSTVAAELDTKLDYFSEVDHATSAVALQDYKVVPCVSQAEALRKLLNSVPAKNHYLRTLKQIFPTFSPYALRTQILAHKRQHVWRIIQDLLQPNAPASRGRARASTSTSSQSVRRHEQFRSEEYKKGAEDCLCNAFPLLWTSQIAAILEEFNFDYCAAHEQCHTINSTRKKGWLDWWSRKERSPVIPPDLREDLTHLQTLQDGTYAAHVNRAEYEAEGQLLECECCYDEVEAEQVCPCLAGHILCRRCVRKHVEDVVYSSGTSAVQPVTCFSCEEPCHSPFPQPALLNTLGPDLSTEYFRKLAAADLKAAGLQTIQCPFCATLQVRPPVVRREGRQNGRFALSVLGFHCVYHWLGAKYMFVLLLFNFAAYSLRFHRRFRGAWYRLSKVYSAWKCWVWVPRASSATRCHNADCQVAFCTSCFAEAHHGDCLDLSLKEGTMDGLRTYIEDAMAQVMMRICPNCHLQFNKSDGCNKMTCPCGYTMCYLCRAPLKDEGYRHFCQHFRVVPGTKCTECNKCELYGDLDWDKRVMAAGQAAKTQFLQLHPHLIPQADRLKIGQYTF